MTDERAFLQAILEQPDDDARKLVYADWLEERGDPRSEYLRLMMKVRQERVITPEQRQRHQELAAELAEIRTASRQPWSDRLGTLRVNRRRIQELEGQLAVLSRQMRQPVPARLRELAATLDPNWLGVVSDPMIEGCGKDSGDSWRIRFRFVCDKTWADLKTTDDQTVRHCETCSKNVHFCNSIADARIHGERGHCIAVSLGIIRREGDLNPPMVTMGIPAMPDFPRREKQTVDPVSPTGEQGGKKRTR